MEREKPCPVFDADSHVYEPTEIWTEFLDADYRVPARSAFLREVDENGIEVILVNGAPARPLNGMSRIKPSGDLPSRHDPAGHRLTGPQGVPSPDRGRLRRRGPPRRHGRDGDRPSAAAAHAVLRAPTRR